MNQTDAVICCIAKDEQRYILEWITYHLKLGFAKIYIYDNSDDFNTKLFFEKIDKKITDKLVLIHFPGRGQQVPAYENFRVHHSKKHTWTAIIDIDEFIVMKEWMPISKFLEKYCATGALGLNWRLFGDSGHTVYTDEPVTSRFIMCQKGINPHVKSISKNSDVERYNIHNSTTKKGILKDCFGNHISGPFNNKGNLNIAYINHYFVKSKEEWTIKRLRGRSDGLANRQDREFVGHNINEVEDLSAKEFYLNDKLDFNI